MEKKKLCSQLALCECQKCLKTFLFDLIFDFLDMTSTLIYSLFIVIVLNVKPLSPFIYPFKQKIWLWNDTHTQTHQHSHVHEHTDVCGYEQFNLSTMTFHTQSHISNVMCQKINNPYMSSVCRSYVWVWVSMCVV